ncbi:helix-turn-helix transcriptional regulator [Pseudomonas agarici]|uniref:helix-turn-helix transcriptional regulator n=1 Tax=Pseudomonas agarici TaxID=46677 RepID=UPI000361158E|nr:AraC family transcriptional regulator [Pseudomonas agarici]NWB91474.1 AraC family transcriptional regulator [Pseudomonas agarici]NWC07778.1 AraC family transcriptional regulator [Pseudomonas agarici]SEK74146.1 AraC-type DNA-binding protein [Pseudomonas agarici]
MYSFAHHKDTVCRITCTGKIERIEGFLSTNGTSPHRHDTYSIGRTLSGVHNIAYRGAIRHSLPGSTFVLHPDEDHSGAAANEAGVIYQALQIEPALIQRVLGGKPLPFVPDGISTDPRLFSATKTLLHAVDYPQDPLQEDDALFDLAMALSDAHGFPASTHSYDYIAAERAREFIHDAIDRSITIEALADSVGRDRWALSRDFRALFGTSPHRYLTMRRLDLVKNSLANGESLTEAATNAGFFDQSHMTRHFTKTFGLSPSRWLKFRGGWTPQWPLSMERVADSSAFGS